MANEAEPFADAVQAVQRTAQACGVPMLLVGAHARDLLLQEWGVEASMRKTRDIDFGFRVGSWDEYRTLRKALAATGEFEIVGRNPHTVLYQGRIEVDLVPSGRSRRGMDDRHAGRTIFDRKWSFSATRKPWIVQGCVPSRKFQGSHFRPLSD